MLKENTGQGTLGSPRVLLSDTVPVRTVAKDRSSESPHLWPLFQGSMSQALDCPH